MTELLVLLQALMLIAGWLLFVRAQAELRAQAARQSLTGELESLRQTVDALLQRLAEDAATACARIEARLQELEQRAQAAHIAELPTADKPAAETFEAESGYNLSATSEKPYGAIVRLATQGLSVAEIARQTGYPPGEVELILNLKRRLSEENQ